MLDERVARFHAEYVADYINKLHCPTEQKLKLLDAVAQTLIYKIKLIRGTADRYFFIEQFFETDLQKITPRAPMGSRIFGLMQVLETESLPKVDLIAKLLSLKIWG